MSLRSTCIGRLGSLLLAPPGKPCWTSRTSLFGLWNGCSLWLHLVVLQFENLNMKVQCDSVQLYKNTSVVSSVQFSCSAMSDSLQPHGLQHTRPPCPSPNVGAYSNSCPLSPWCHPTILSSVVPFSSCLQCFPASGACLMSQLFALGSQSIGVSASTTVLPMNTQDWLPLGWTGWISLQSKGLSRVFSNITVQKHQFFST